MSKSTRWLALVSIIALVMLSLLGGIVSALAGNGDASSVVKETVMAEGAEGIVPDAEAAPAEEKALGGEPALELAPQEGILCAYGKICAIKFLDANENGKMDPGETGLAGVTITLNGGNAKVTGSDGKVCFDNLDPGRYTVSEIVPDGYHATTQTSYTKDICWDQVITVYFGNAPDVELKGSISGTKYNDVDGSGDYSAGDLPLAGVTIELWKDGVKVGETTTAADGTYSFGDLPAGNYTVKEIVPAGTEATSPISVNVPVAEGQDVTCIDFFNKEKVVELKGSISGTKYNDVDGSGDYSAGDLPLAGVTIELWKDGVKVGETTTAADGTYSFGDLPAGDYTVKEIVPAGTEATSPVSVDVAVAEDQEVTCIDFFNKVKICEDGIIEATVRVDENCDGEFTWDDMLLDGVTFRLYHIEADNSLTPVSPPSMISGPGWGYNVIFYVIKIPVYYPGGHVIWEGLPRAYGDSTTVARYRLVMEVPEGYTAISPVTYDLELHNCPWPCYWFSMNFLLSRNSHLRGHKYEDMNCNGIYDEGVDEPLEGWTIELYDKDGIFITSTTTNADGEYSFEDLPEGVYTVKEVLQDGWRYIYPEDGTYVDVPVGCGDVDGKDFFNARDLSISGHKYEDADCDGEIGAEDPGVPGVEVQLFIWNDGSSEYEYLASTLTGAGGYYEFTGLKPGTYKVQEVLTPELLEDWYIISPTDGIFVPVVLECESALDLDFLNARYLGISGHKYEDADCDGEIGAEDPGVPGVEVQLFIWNDGSSEYEYLASTLTGAGGYYEFTGLKPGTYKVQEVLTPELLEDWYIISPTDGIFVPVVLECESALDLDFLNARYGAIEGWKYWDKDENGIMDGDDEGLAGVTIILDPPPDLGAPQVTVTDAEGYFFFGHLKPGMYTVSVDESTVPDYYPISPVSVEVDVVCGQTVKVYFSEAPYGSISGKKWLDANFDGIWGEDETIVIEGITINLYEGETIEGDPIATTVTGADGYYEFTKLQPGTYTVVEEGKEGYFSCTPDSVTVTLSAGEGTVIDFGNCPYGRVEGLKFLDLDGDGSRDEGEPTLEGVEITLEGINAMAITTTGEDGTFIFKNLVPGEYTVSEKVPSGYYATRPISVEVVVGPGESVSVIFANALYGSIVGNKWMDDGDTLLDPEKDTPKAGMTIELTGTTLSGEPVSMQATTQEDGSYAFLLLEAGNYNVSEVYDPKKMKPLTPDSIDVQLAPGGEAVVNFLNVEVEVGGEVVNPPSATLPATGMDQLPLLIAAAILVFAGLIFLVSGLRRRYQE
jgi:protocatechuate 3,4-dioxygenase beta subunit